MSPTRQTCPCCNETFEVIPSGRGGQASCPSCGCIVSVQAAPPQPLWYYAHGKQKCGPVPLGELQRLFAAGELRATDMVLQAGAVRWGPLGAVDGLVPQAIPVSAAPWPTPTPARPVADAATASAAPAALTAGSGWKLPLKAGAGGLSAVLVCGLLFMQNNARLHREQLQRQQRLQREELHRQQQLRQQQQQQFRPPPDLLTRPRPAGARTCPKCRGSGKGLLGTCPDCRGYGWLPPP